MVVNIVGVMLPSNLTTSENFASKAAVNGDNVMNNATSLSNQSVVNKVQPNGMTARVILCLLTTAGFYYINIMPALVDSLVEGLGFSHKQAGLVSSSNVYGTALGALMIVFLIKRISWKPSAAVLLLVLIAIDSLSMQLASATQLLAVRFLHGLASGALVGIGFAIIARTENPDRTFGVLLLVQFSLSGFGVMFLPPLVPEFGTAPLFLALITFAVVSLVLLPFLPDYEADETSAAKITVANINVKLLLTLLGIFLFQVANMGLYAFIISLGAHYGLEDEFINPVLGAAAWIGIVGAILAIVIATRFGRLLPLMIAMGLTVVGTIALLFSEVPLAYIVANCGVAMTWSFVMPYLFGMCAEFDKAGQMAALGGFASKMGLASGPFVASIVLGESQFGLLINLAVVALVVAMVGVFVPARVLGRQLDT
jgi:predicted MFS family arabinose efflux permease